METNEHIIDIKTDNSAKLKILFEVLKDIVPQTNITFINEKSL
jgi:hypothetical protein